MMRPVALAVALVLALPGLALAAERGGAAPGAQKHRVHAPYSGYAGHYPLSWRAKKVRNADGCWRACLADGGRAFQACLRAHPLTSCVQRNAVADRYCLHECRGSGGPWVRLVD